MILLYFLTLAAALFLPRGITFKEFKGYLAFGLTGSLLLVLWLCEGLVCLAVLIWAFRTVFG